MQLDPLVRIINSQLSLHVLTKVNHM